MGRRDIRLMLMGPKKRMWDRPWVVWALMSAVLAFGVGIGVFVGYRQAPLTAPAVAVLDDRSPMDRPARREAVPGSDYFGATPDRREETASVPLILPQPPVKPTAPDTPTWLRFVVPAPRTAGQQMIAIIIDDLGLDKKRTERVETLRAPLTLALMTYAEDLARQTAAARGRGHELMLHVPMQPLDGAYDPGPDVLEVGLSPDELRRRIDWGLSRFEGFIGVNNHMGSRFTADRAGMRVVMEELKKRGLAFVDSVTTDRSVGEDMARRYGVPFATRQVFLDNEQDVRSIRAQLAKVEALARAHGSAIAIGHPHDATVEALASWLPGLDARGLVLVPVSAIIRANNPPKG